MTEQEILLEARLVALEHLVARTYNTVRGVLNLTDKEISDAESGMLERTALVPVENAPPEWSDLISAEIRDASERLLLLARDLRQGG